MDFGTRLKILRRDKKMSQSELANSLGLSANTISQYETGKRFPDQNGIVSICHYFGVSADFLLGLSDIKQLSKMPQAHTPLNQKQQNAIYDLISAFKNSED